jgi:hypothetical protein
MIGTRLASMEFASNDLDLLDHHRLRHLDPHSNGDL